MKYSIIIPTYNKCDELLKPCLESILKYTDIGAETEIIVIANGCTDNTREYVKSLERTSPFISLLDYPQAIGFTKAVNIGMKFASGEYFIIMNNDTILLPQDKNAWLNILNAPFKDQYRTQVGITGPMKVPNDRTGLPFLIFFCVMVSRQCYIDIGPLDEIFSPGYGEDTDYCLRAESRYYECVQVPRDSNLYYADKRMVGDFPIYHAGNQTFKDHPDEALIHRNNDIIAERWGKTTGSKVVEPFLDQKKVHNNEFDNMLMRDRIEKANTEIVSKIEEHLDDTNSLLGFEERVAKKIAEKYGHEIPSFKVPIDISKARNCDGYMADSELEWLATQAQAHRVIVEVGSWHGKSSRALVDNLALDGSLICVDHWNGSTHERSTNHASAMNEGGDAAYLEFLENMWDTTGTKMHSIRLRSENAAKFLKNHNFKADMIFIDAGHTKEEVREDILNWLPLLKEDGIICGHDAFHVNNPFPGVLEAAREIFGTNVAQAPNTSIWYVYKPSQIKLSSKPPEVKVKRPPCVYDCFMYNNEIDVLLERFQTMYDAVDRFIIVEARETHAGKPKELTFEANLEKWGHYANKVTYLIIDKFPETEGSVTDKSWARERYQRDFIMNGITDCQDDDIIIISDCDEIIYPDSIKWYKEKEKNTIIGIEMNLYYYNKHVMAVDKWNEARITTYSRVKAMTPCGVRYDKPHYSVSNGGVHLSYFGGVEAVIKKIEDTAHQEYNKPEFKDPNVIADRMYSGKDVFGRENIKFQIV